MQFGEDIKTHVCISVKFECKSPIGTRARLELEEKFWNHVGPGDDIPGYGRVWNFFSVNSEAPGDFFFFPRVNLFGKRHNSWILASVPESLTFLLLIPATELIIRTFKASLCFGLFVFNLHQVLCFKYVSVSLCCLIRIDVAYKETKTYHFLHDFIWCVVKIDQCEFRI